LLKSSWKQASGRRVEKRLAGLDAVVECWNERRR
jgi:hypothetical protein